MKKSIFGIFLLCFALQVSASEIDEDSPEAFLRRGLTVGGLEASSANAVPIMDKKPEKIPFFQNSVPSMKTVVLEANEAIAACNAKGETAANMCLASSSPAIHNGILIVSSIISGMGASTTVSQSCTKYNKALAAGKMAMTAYATSCTAVQMMCDTACTKAITAVKSVASYSGPFGPGEQAAAAPTYTEAQERLKAAASTEAQCQGYKLAMGAAALGIINMVKEANTTSNCENKTAVVDCLKTPKDPACKTAEQLAAEKMDCSKPENAQLTNCICARAPTTAGCAGANGSNSGLGPSNSTGNSLTNTKPGSVSPGSGLGADGSGLAGSGSGGSGSGGGGGAGAASRGSGTDGSAGMSGGGGKAAAGSGATGKAGLNANILDGSGGGGGGGFRGAGSRDLGNSAYKAYLPGGAKDPARAPGSAHANEVTSAGSKSNWEKVSERYRDNKASLVQGR